MFFFLFSIPLSLGVSYIIYLPLNDLGPLLVDHPSHHSSAYPIGHLHRLSVSWSNQGSIVQGSSPHKYGQKVSCRAFNAVVTVPAEKAELIEKEQEVSVGEIVVAT